MDIIYPTADDNAALYAENSVAGALLLEPVRVLHEIRGMVTADDFRNEAAQAIFRAVASLVDGRQPCDPVTIVKAAAEAGMPVSEDYCAGCMEVTPTTRNATEYAKIVHDAAQRRRAAQIGTDLARGDSSPVEALGRLQELLRMQSSSVLSPSEAAHQVMDYFAAAADGKVRPFLSTGFWTIDQILSGGLVTGGLITMAARPGTGKSTAALCIADNVAASGKKVLYVSLEMPKEQLWACRLANYTGFSRGDIYTGAVLNDERAGRFTGSFDAMCARPFYVRDIPSTLEDIEREARRIDDLALLVVDHLGLIKPAAEFRGSRYEAMTDTAHRLKQLALSMRIPILALCQLNRQSVQRENKRPTMADLRDSGAIEEDSDVVCLLHRASMYEDEKPQPWEVQEITFLVDKNRHGATGAIRLGFCGDNSRILEKKVANGNCD